MLSHVLFTVNLFPTEAERESSQKRVLCLLEALVWINRIYLQEHPETPLIYQSGIKYKVPEQFEHASLPEVDTVSKFLKDKGASKEVQEAFKTLSNMCGGGENFRDIPKIIENGGGDCDNVASWRVAELRELGIQAKPYITWRKREDGGTTYHVIVLHPDGSSEDPSLLLGMSYPYREPDRIAEEEKLGERCGNFIAGLARNTVLGAINTPQNFNQLQYTIPFQTSDMYDDWYPTRPQAFYANPLYSNLPTTKGGGPILNTRMRDEDFDDRFEGYLKALISNKRNK
jgi:hypothetical protein